MSTLIVLPTLHYSGAASQARLLAEALSRENQDVHVAVLGPTGPWEEDLRNRGVTVHLLHWSRPLDPAPLWRLHELLRSLKPTSLHAIGLSALRCLAAAPDYLPRTWAHRLLLEKSDWTPADQLLFRSLRGAQARCRWEAAHLQQAGFSPERVQVTPWSLLEEFHDIPDVPRRPESIVSLSRLEHRHSPRDAVWAVDILAYAFPDLRLDLIGTGSLAERLRQLRDTVYFPQRTRLQTAVADVRPMLAQAQVCWITARPGHGLQTALEALACGCPVVAYDQPMLREVLADGVTGFFVPPGDMMALARKTYLLLTDEQRARRMGQAARDWTARWTSGSMNPAAEPVPA